MALNHGCISVFAETEGDNTASIRVLEKCGFTAVGTYGEEGPIFRKTKQDS